MFSSKNQNGTVSNSVGTVSNSQSDELMKRAIEISHGDDARIAQVLKSQCASMLENLKKGMQENETNPHDDSKAYLAKIYIEQLTEYKKTCE